jgi:TRAP-type C4-dicarboxylate transport system permease small subunit
MKSVDHDIANLPSGPLQRGLTRLSAFAVAVAGAAMLGLVAVQGWQVFARYVLNDSPSWTEPVTLLLLSSAMSFGAAAGVHERRHFRFHLLAHALPPVARHASEAITAAVIAAIGGTLAWWGTRLLFDGLDIRMAGAPLPQSISFLPLALGGLLMVLFAMPQLVHAFAGGTAQGED